MFGRLFLADMKMLLRNKQSLFWAMVFPIIFATVFGLFDFGNIDDAEVAIFSEDPVLSAAFAGAIDAGAPFEIDESYRSVEDARAALEDDELDLVLVGGSGGRVELLYNEAQDDQNAIYRPIVQQVISEVNLRATGAEPRFRLEPTPVSGIEVQYYDFVLPGLVGMAVMTYGIIGLGSLIAQYRGQRILRRILATPLKPRTFLTAVVLAHLVLAVVQSTIVLLFGMFVFDGLVRGNVLWIYVFVILGNLTFLNIGFMVAARVDTAEAASGMGNAVAMPMMFLSGVFFPTAGLPWIMPELTQILPLRPMVDAIRSVAIDATSITDHLGEVAQLAAWALVTFVIASRVFRFEKA